MFNTIAIVGLLYTLPERLTPGPNWVAPAITLLLLAAAVVTNRIGRSEWNFRVGVFLQCFITAVEIWSLAFLILTLPQKRENAGDLLHSAAALWVCNILISASWYWRLDAGGPNQRELRDRHCEGAFLFPHMTLPHALSAKSAPWKPGFIDYLFLAFNTSTAFSPTDTPVLSGWAKVVMMMQALISLGIIAILLARGISLL